MAAVMPAVVMILVLVVIFRLAKWSAYKAPKGK